MTYDVEAIVLRRETWRETARIYTFYTREHGKLLAVARGTRKATSKLAAHLEPFTRLDAFLARGRKVETICGAIMKRSPEPLVESETRHLAAGFVAEAVDHLVKAGERDERMWPLIDGVFAQLSMLDDGGIPAALAGFLWRFMDRLGYRPRLDECLACERAIGFDGAFFLPLRGAAVCRSCHPDERLLAGAEVMDGPAIEAIRSFIDQEAPSDPAPAGVLRPAAAFLEAHLDRPLTTLPLVREALIYGRAAAKVPEYAESPRF